LALLSNRQTKEINIPAAGLRKVLLVAGASGLGVGGGLLTVLLPNPLLGFVALAGLLVGGLMLAKPLFTLGAAVTICTLLPFATLPFRTGFLTFTLLELSLLALFAIWLFRLAVGSRLRGSGSEQALVTSPFDWAILLFIALSVFSYILNWQTAATGDIIHAYAKLLLAILTFFAVLNIVQTQAALDRLVQIIMISGALAGYIGAGLTRLPRDLQERLLTALRPLGYPTERVLRFVEDDAEGKPQRATGTSVDPNSYGGMLVLIIALLVTQLVAKKPLLPRWATAALLPGPAIALYLTYGRGAQLGAIAVIALVATVKYRKIWLYGLPFIVAGALWLPSSFLGQRLAAGFALEDQATLMRLAEYQNALDIIAAYPWFGVGFGFAPSVELTVGVSMIYLTIAEQMGLIGLAAFGLVMVLFFIYVATHWGKIRDEKQAAIVLGATGGVVGALAVGCLDHYFFNGEFSHMGTLFWLFMAVAVVQIKIAEGTPPSATKNEASSS
jgi:polysaccharide biosynthesis protein PslJ